MANYFDVKADPTARISPKASILGDVTIGPDTTVFGGAYIRGDMAPVRIGTNSNVQECAVIHVDTDFPCTVGDNVTIGHGAGTAVSWPDPQAPSCTAAPSATTACSAWVAS